mgnify:CR=1 FL=1
MKGICSEYQSWYKDGGDVYYEKEQPGKLGEMYGGKVFVKGKEVSKNKEL